MLTMRLRFSFVFHRIRRSHFSEQLIFVLDLSLNMRFMKNNRVVVLVTSTMVENENKADCKSLDIHETGF